MISAQVALPQGVSFDAEQQRYTVSQLEWSTAGKCIRLWVVIDECICHVLIRIIGYHWNTLEDYILDSVLGVGFLRFRSRYNIHIFIDN